jgi:CDC45-like protein
MIYKTHSLSSVYKNIKKQTIRHNSSITIFCSYSIDSITTTKLLTTLFSKDQLKYKVIPIASYADLDCRISELKDVDNLGFIFLVNCGARAEISKYWFFDEAEIAEREEEEKDDAFGVIILDN